MQPRAVSKTRWYQLIQASQMNAILGMNNLDSLCLINVCTRTANSAIAPEYCFESIVIEQILHTKLALHPLW